MAKTLTLLEKRLAGYAAAAGMALAVTPAVDAQVVYTDVNPDEVLDVSTNPTYAIDFDGDSNTDITIEQRLYTGLPSYYGILQLGLGAGVMGYQSVIPYASALSSGNPISSLQSFGTFPLMAMSAYGGPWTPGVDAYIGIRFTADLLGSPTTHYGWVRVAVNSYDEHVVKGYAFESLPDTPINAATIPVELTSFTAQTNGDAVVLGWETASETNNAGFEVQMQQGGDWTALGFVEGNGTTTEAQAYSFTADGMDIGTHTFRLKQIDFDGAFEYSGEVEATIEVVGTHQLSNAYPNPFNPSSQFTLAVATNQHVKAELYNVLGQRVSTLFDGSVDANAAQIVQIDGSGLASGAYIVRVTGENFADALRVTLTK